MNNINLKLIQYIRDNILTEYIKNDEGHQLSHIQYVIDRSFQLSQGIEVNNDMVYTIAAYHDIGHHIDKDNHEKISAEIMFNDKNLLEFFSKDELFLMKEAIEDHRASMEDEPRNIYGKIVSSADRTINIDVALKRTYWYSINHFPDYTINQHIDRAYNHLKEKFGSNGYAKMDLKDEVYENYLIDLNNLLSNREKFEKKFIEINNI